MGGKKRSTGTLEKERGGNMRFVFCHNLGEVAAKERGMGFGNGFSMVLLLR